MAQTTVVLSSVFIIDRVAFIYSWVCDIWGVWIPCTDCFNMCILERYREIHFACCVLELYFSGNFSVWASGMLFNCLMTRQIKCACKSHFSPVDSEGSLRWLVRDLQSECVTLVDIFRHLHCDSTHGRHSWRVKAPRS